MSNSINKPTFSLPLLHFNKVTLLVVFIILIFKILTSQAASNEQSFAPGITLPEGEGQALLIRACTKCHDLKGLPAYKGYWNKSRWLSMVDTMIDHGAKLEAEERLQVADYLAQHFGPE